MADKKEKLTPMEIHNKEFNRRGRNGYDRYEVDSFLDQIVDNYGDALDENVDLKNKIVSLQDSLNAKDQEIANLQGEVDKLKQRESEVNEVLVSARKSAKEIRDSAQAEADKLIANAKSQAETDTKFEKQQSETLSKDYDRLKEEVGNFRAHLQDMLKKQIDSLNDEDWQQALDTYFDTPRYYPEDGSEPIDEDEIDEADLSDDFYDDADDEVFDEDSIGEPDHIDKKDLDDVESSQEPVNDDNEHEAQPMTGDSSNTATFSPKVESNDQISSHGATIVFPDDYKEHR